MIWLPAGPQAVSLFFVLSGFVLTYNYLGRDTTPREFWVARAKRLYPDYLLAFVIAAPFVIGASVAWYRTVVAGVAYLTMTQAWLPWTLAAWHFPAWSLSVEAFFYLCFPWLLPRIARLGGWSCVGVILGAYLVSGSVFFAHPERVLGAANLQAAFVMGWPPVRLPEFIMGMCAGRMFLLRPRPTADAGWLALAIGAGCLWGQVQWPGAWRGVWAPLFAMMILLLARDDGEIAWQIKRRPLIWLGEISYGIYILQAPVYWAMGFTAQTMTPGKLGAYVAVLIAVAGASHYGVAAWVRSRRVGMAPTS